MHICAYVGKNVCKNTQGVNYYYQGVWKNIIMRMTFTFSCVCIFCIFYFVYIVYILLLQLYVVFLSFKKQERLF